VFFVFFVFSYFLLKHPVANATSSLLRRLLRLNVSLIVYNADMHLTGKVSLITDIVQVVCFLAESYCITGADILVDDGRLIYGNRKGSRSGCLFYSSFNGENKCSK
jgi:hypothetical protein